MKNIEKAVRSDPQKGYILHIDSSAAFTARLRLTSMSFDAFFATLRRAVEKNLRNEAPLYMVVAREVEARH